MDGLGSQKLNIQCEKLIIDGVEYEPVEKAKKRKKALSKKIARKSRNKARRKSVKSFTSDGFGAFCELLEGFITMIFRIF